MREASNTLGDESRLGLIFEYLLEVSFVHNQVVFPGELRYLFQLPYHSYWNLLKLSERIQHTPAPSLSHFAELQNSNAGNLACLFGHFKQGPEDSLCVLGNEDHVCVDGVKLGPDLTDVKLEQNLDFGSGIGFSHGDGNGDVVVKLLYLHLFFVSNTNALEFLGLRKYIDQVSGGDQVLEQLFKNLDLSGGEVEVGSDLGVIIALEGSATHIVFQQSL